MLIMIVNDKNSFFGGILDLCRSPTFDVTNIAGAEFIRQIVQKVIMFHQS